MHGPSAADYTHLPGARKEQSDGRNADWPCSFQRRRHDGRPQSVSWGFARSMLLSSSTEPALPSAWTDVLDHIQRVLADAMRAADARAQALELTRPDEAGNALLVSQGNDLLAQPSGTPLSCEQEAVEIEQVLAAAQEALDRWLATAAKAAQRLAEQAARAV
jgi:hypothetical protein